MKISQKAKNITVEPTGTVSSKDYGSWLVKNGYRSKSYKEASIGDVAVMDSIGVHKHGHLQIFCNDKKCR